MADVFDPETRSRVMARVKNRDTGPEMLLRQALRRRGLTGYRCHYRRAVGKPDIAFVGRRLAVFVDGAFWHGHPDRFRFGQSGERWDTKVRRNMERDREVDEVLRAEGWAVLRIWDFEVNADPEAAAARVGQALESNARR